MKQDYPDDQTDPEDVPWEERPYVLLEDMDEETRREVLKTRRAIKLVGIISIGSIAIMIVFTIIAVMLN